MSLESTMTIAMFVHREKTGHTKFTILGGGKKRKHQINWQIIKCKECGEAIR